MDLFLVKANLELLRYRILQLGDALLSDSWEMVYGSSSRQIHPFSRGSELTGHGTELKLQPSPKWKEARQSDGT